MSKRSGARRGGRARVDATRPGAPKLLAGIEGGRYAPLSSTEITAIDSAARRLVSDLGLADAPPLAIELATKRGGRLTDDGRLCFPGPLIDAALTGLRGPALLCGQSSEHDLELSGTRVYMGTGGAAPNVVDLETGLYRASTLGDLYAASRIVDALDHIHFFSRSLVARDIQEPRALDLNTAYASLTGTSKHVMTSVSHVAHLDDIAQMCFLIAGTRATFLARPFLSLNINHVTPPLRFAPEAVDVLIQAARLGLPVHCNTFGQLGASSPVTMAGCLAQTMAETLAGVILAWLANPDALAIFGPRPMITDLRNGAMSGGGGEQALLMAATIQMARHYGLPNSCIAGATDAKTPDAQSGFEKSLSISLAAHAGANLITQAAGMHAGLMGVAFESYVIDNDMLGAVLRSLGPIEIDRAALAVDEIGAVARGAGHFLGQPQTLARMETDFLYPQISDRRGPQEWEDTGAPQIRSTARHRVCDILDQPHPDHIGRDLDSALRARFEIALPSK